jgi:hypothetical protein
MAIEFIGDSVISVQYFGSTNRYSWRQKSACRVSIPNNFVIRFWDLYFTKFIPFPFHMTTIQLHIIRILQISEPEPGQKRTCEMKILRPNPERILKTQIFQTIRSYVFVAWFPDLSVTIRICILPCLYNLKRQTETNLARILKYMILKDYCTERPLLAIEVWSAEVETCNMRPFHPPLRQPIFYGSRDQRPPGSLLPKSKYPGNEVAKTSENSKLRKAILSAFYNILQRNFGILSSCDEIFV